jgi:maltose/moltooligosaccharide transporter
VALPNSPLLWVAAVMLWVMNASVNVSMEPFRAFVADQLPSSQRPLGFALQSLFIGVGGVLSSILPWLLARFGIINVAPAGQIPATVRIAFYAGAAVLLAAVSWTVFTTHEYPPERLHGFSGSPPASTDTQVARAWLPGSAMLVLGVIGVLLIRHFSLDAELYLFAVGLAVIGGLYLWLARTRSRGMLRQVMADLYGMPGPMRRLAWVQFFSWFAMFAMWNYLTPTVASVQFGSSNPLTAAYNAGANWADVLNGAYSGFAVLAAAIIPLMVRHAGLRWSHLINLTLAALGLISFVWIRNPDWLLLSMLGVGFGWASILSLPYTLLADNLPAEKMGVYMGMFNLFITLPQILGASVLGVLLHVAFRNQPVYGLVLGGVSLLIAGLCTLRVAEPGAGALAAGVSAQQA